MQPQLIDSHCHVNFNAFKADADEVMRRSLADGIWVNVVGSQIDTSYRAIEYAKEYEAGVFASVGLHPIHLYTQAVDEEEDSFITRAEKFDYARYKELASHEKVIAIGEMGYDYYHLPRGLTQKEAYEMQKKTFEQGIKLAKELDQPIIIHTRSAKGTYDAYDDVYNTLRESDYARGVVHCFGGTLKQAKKFLDMGVYLGMTGIVTFKNAKDIQEIVHQIPLDKLLVETDAPYLAPEPHRGKRNEPAFVRFVAEKIAEIKNTTFEEVAGQTTENAKALFNL